LAAERQSDATLPGCPGYDGQHLDWTTNLGEAFLAQQRDMMDSIQRLRQMAYQQGRLTTTREVVVRFDPQTQMIFIEPANPQMVYVPVYDSEVVYGTGGIRTIRHIAIIIPAIRLLRPFPS